MPAVIFDSSVVVKWFSRVDEKNYAKAGKLLERWKSGDFEVVEPELVVAELANVLLVGKKWRKGEVVLAIEKFYEIEPELVAMDVYWREAVELAVKHDITVYDSVYLALAKRRGGILISDDAKHHGKAKDPAVVMLADFTL